jgi:hypothetical protein
MPDTFIINYKNDQQMMICKRANIIMSECWVKVAGNVIPAHGSPLYEGP